MYLCVCVCVCALREVVWEGGGGAGAWRGLKLALRDPNPRSHLP